jgi:hypothetical protein
MSTKWKRPTSSVTDFSSFLISVFLETALREYVARIPSLMKFRFVSTGFLELKFAPRSPQLHL